VIPPPAPPDPTMLIAHLSDLHVFAAKATAHVRPDTGYARL
jgi:hypothetical protein